MTLKRTITHRARRERNLPDDLDDLSEGDILWDRHRHDCYLVTGVDDRNVALRQRDTEFYVPHSLVIPWYGSRLFPIEHTTSVEVPEWCRQANSPVQ